METTKGGCGGGKDGGFPEIGGRNEGIVWRGY